jgi:LmbE family N-acetylglucosaminyl deacetylase
MMQLSQMMKKIAQIACAATLVLTSVARAQLPNEDYRGVAATGLNLRQLATAERILVIAAHPDDEDNQLLTALSIGRGADVAYLSLNRGEGGQNSIGGELGVSLGILRTEELLAARKLDRSGQFFTRAQDFGFSKTADETLRHWPRDSILGDVVSTIRRFRPDIIIAIFTGTPRDGHGHHQVSGILAREAFVAAGDPTRFPEQLRAGLEAYRPLKLFQATGYRQAAPTERIPTGELDPLLGRSISQIAAESRSRHRSQDQGQLQAQGPRFTSVRLLQSLVDVHGDSTLFAGMDTTLALRALHAQEKPDVVRLIQRYDSLIAAARAQLRAYNTSNTADMIAQAISTLTSAAPVIRDYNLGLDVAAERREAERALVQSSGIVVDAIADTEVLVPGTSFNLEVSVWNGGSVPVRVPGIAPLLPAGWQAQSTDSTTIDAVQAGALLTRHFRVTLPQGATLSQPYFVAKPQPGDYYAWPDTAAWAGLPFQPEPVRASATVNVRGLDVAVLVNATRRVVDPRSGELRRAPYVAPAFAMRPDPAISVVTLAALASGDRKPVNVSVEVVSNGAGGSVTVKPQLPAGWHATPEAANVVLAGPGDSRLARFAIELPRNAVAGKYDVLFVATDSAGRSYSLQQQLIDYPHITNRILFAPADMHISVLNARFARGMRVGYIIGTDEPVPSVLEQMGVAVDRLDENALANADLSKYDAVVVGSRAYEVRPDLRAHNARVLDYGRKGGNVVVMYQKYEFIQGKFFPYPMTIASPHDRITNENSPVRFVDSASVTLTRPNRITQEDFKGWVQERTLYMPHTWSPEYKPVLEMNDPDEAPQQGAILTAPLGSGHYTYTGIAFIREVPAGVPGALRLFINLLSQGVKDVAF